MFLSRKQPSILQHLSSSKQSLNCHSVFPKAVICHSAFPKQSITQHLQSSHLTVIQHFQGSYPTVIQHFQGSYPTVIQHFQSSYLSCSISKAVIYHSAFPVMCHSAFPKQSSNDHAGLDVSITFKAIISITFKAIICMNIHSCECSQCSVHIQLHSDAKCINTRSPPTKNLCVCHNSGQLQSSPPQLLALARGTFRGSNCLMWSSSPSVSTTTRMYMVSSFR